MEIIGHGLDVVDTQNLANLSEESVAAWEGEVFSEDELREVDNLDRTARMRRLSGKFAAKEAIFKAAGGSTSGEIAWPEIKVLTEVSGRPYAILSGEWQERCQALQIKEFLVSISYSGSFAFGSAIAISDPN